MKDKDLLLRLLRKKNKNIYHIVLVKKRAFAMSNLDSIGKISKVGDNYGMVYLNLKKLTKYLYKGIAISESFGKVLGIEKNK